MKLEITHFYSNSNVFDCPKEKTPEYAFIGRSNVGKSTLINFILNTKIARTSSKPGKTQLINHIVINNNWSLVDLPGYGYAKISKKMRSVILKRTENYFINRGTPLVAAFMLIDIRIPPQKIDLRWMSWLVENNIYFIIVFTKCDGLNNNQITQYINNYDKTMKTHNWSKFPETIITSSTKKRGRIEILERIIKLNKLFQNI